jgi:glycosyltransferase involved in cell wall biosynthesis
MSSPSHDIVPSPIEKVSIVLPVFNEEESLHLLNQKITETMNSRSWAYEIIYVDDGSGDRSADVIRELALRNDHVRGIILRRNFGQSAATAAGIDQADGDIIVIMDSDMQNDPADIPKLVERIEAGADIVSGWRKHRKDNVFIRNFPSWVANRLIKKISGLKIHDLGCSLKAYRKEIIKEVKLYGETHRFIAIYANMIGGTVEEVEVRHHPRQFGVSKYGLNRVVKVLLDLITLQYMLRYATRPIYFFGKLSLFVTFLGMCSFGGLLAHKFMFGTSFVRSPFLLLTSMLVLVAFQTLITGLIAEILMRVYHESQKKPVYHIRETIRIRKP